VATVSIRGFAGTRDAGKDADLAFGDAQRDVFEIVLARTVNLDVFLRHGQAVSQKESVIKNGSFIPSCVSVLSTECPQALCFPAVWSLFGQ
jgi:hypothetical protein